MSEEDKEIKRLEREVECINDPIDLVYRIHYYYDKDKMGDKINELVDEVNKLKESKK